MRYFVIGDEDLVLGMTMIGVSGTIVSTVAETEQAFKTALNDEENAIILISEKLAKPIRPMLEQYMFSHKLPLICEIEGIDGADESKPSLKELANKAIGIKL